MNDSRTEASAFDGVHAITEIIAMLDTPNGFSRLNSNQRKFLLAAILGTIVPIDGKIKAIEVQHLKSHLQTKYNLNADILKSALSYANIGLSAEHMKKASSKLQELLSIDDRTNLISMLWDIALSDDELHSSEEAMIYSLADNAGVPRKRVAAQQVRVQSNRGN